MPMFEEEYRVPGHWLMPTFYDFNHRYPLELVSAYPTLSETLLMIAKNIKDKDER